MRLDTSRYVFYLHAFSPIPETLWASLLALVNEFTTEIGTLQKHSFFPLQIQDGSVV